MLKYSHHVQHSAPARRTRFGKYVLLSHAVYSPLNIYQVTWCWILGAVMCFALAASIAEIVSAFPTSGGLYTASAQLVPRKYRAPVGWIVGWLNILGMIHDAVHTRTAD
jgi:hypothetical protein